MFFDFSSIVTAAAAFAFAFAIPSAFATEEEHKRVVATAEEKLKRAVAAEKRASAAEEEHKCVVATAEEKLKRAVAAAAAEEELERVVAAAVATASKEFLNSLQHFEQSPQEMAVAFTATTNEFLNSMSYNKQNLHELIDCYLKVYIASYNVGVSDKTATVATAEEREAANAVIVAPENKRAAAAETHAVAVEKRIAAKKHAAEKHAVLKPILEKLVEISLSTL